MKLTLLTPALVAILGLALASAPLPMHAQTTTATASTASSSTVSTKPKKGSGTVTAIDTTGNTITIQNKSDGSRTFAIASTATFLKDKKPATLADFAVGDKITLMYTKDASGTMTATKISKTTAKPKTPKPTPATSATSSSAPATSTTSP